MERIAVATFTRMAKRLLVLMAVLAAMLAASVPVFAQDGISGPSKEVVVTGELRELDVDCNKCAHYAITDEATGTDYKLISDPRNPYGGVDLSQYVGLKVTAHGTPQFNADGLYVTQIQPADGSSQPQEGEIATLSFELTVEGEPPAGTQFFGAPGEGGGQFFDAEGNRLGPVPLTDPDGDGVYTGSTTLVNPGTGPVVSLPVQLVQENGGNIEVIRDFGVVGIDGDETFEASVSFDEDEQGPNTPGTPSQDRTATFSFELTVKGTPPEGARFFGVVPAEGCISAPLEDPDGDGVFTGSLDVPRFAPGPVPPGTQPVSLPVSLPVQIVQADSGGGPCNPTGVIKDFGTVPADDDTFKARINFKEGRGGTTPPESTTPDTTTAPGSGSGGSNNSGSSGSGGGSDSGSSGNTGSGNIGSGSGDSGNDAEGSGSPSGVTSGSGATSGVRGLLPSTGGGVALWVLGAGILLIGGGLLVRKLAR